MTAVDEPLSAGRPSVPEMQISMREAACVLGLGQEATRRVLAAGLAGAPVPYGRALEYDAEAVGALRRRPVILPSTVLPEQCADGLLVARLDPRRSPTDIDRLLTGPWRLSVARSAVLSVLLSRGPVPIVGTVAGYVLAAADVVGTQADDRGHLVVRPPGGWFEAFRGHRLPTPPGDPLLFWRCSLCPSLRHDPPSRRVTVAAGRAVPTVRPARPRAGAG